MPMPAFTLNKSYLLKKAESDQSTTINPDKELETGFVNPVDEYVQPQKATSWLWAYIDGKLETYEGTKNDSHYTIWGSGVLGAPRGRYDPDKRILYVYRSKDEKQNKQMPVDESMKEDLLAEFPTLQAVKYLTG